ncbi:MAG TPA: cytidylate kinase family protein [Methylomirabilota bacterium]|nr:cytidylate kinase family protein [Methylomirabilota bacterium]
MSVITISYQMGSGGGEIAHCLADRHGYRCVGSEDLAKVAARYGLSPAKATHLGEARPTLLERLSAETRLYLIVIQAAMYEFAEQDNVILLGHGGQWLLRGIGHALRLRVVAPFQARVHRLARSLTTYSQFVSHDLVREMVRRDDTDKAGRARYLYDSDLDAPALYDVVLNTDRLEVESLVQALSPVVEQLDLAASLESRQVLHDLKLTSQVRAALMAAEETRRHRIEVETRSAVVLLSGSAGLEEGARVASRIPGVREVKQQLIVIPTVPPVVM